MLNLAWGRGEGSQTDDQQDADETGWAVGSCLGASYATTARHEHVLGLAPGGLGAVQRYAPVIQKGLGGAKVPARAVDQGPPR